MREDTLKSHHELAIHFGNTGGGPRNVPHSLAFIGTEYAVAPRLRRRSAPARPMDDPPNLGGSFRDQPNLGEG